MPAPWIEEGCPWYALHMWLPPDIEWCEAARCAVISEPANTWSNLGYVAFGLWVWARGGGKGLARLWGPAMAFMGAMSFGYHATANFIGQWLDHVGMFVFAAIPLTVNVARLRPLGQRGLWGVYLSLVIGTSALILGLHAAELPMQPTVAAMVLGTLGLEARAARTGRAGQGYRTLGFAMATLAGAMLIREVDRQRLYCDPQSLYLQGHAIWHVVSAVSVWAVWRFYRQFDVEVLGREH